MIKFKVKMKSGGFFPLKHAVTQEEHFIPPKEQVLFPHNSFTPDLFNWCIVEAHNQSVSSRKHFVPDLLSCCLIPVKSQNPITSPEKHLIPGLPRCLLVPIKAPNPPPGPPSPPPLPHTKESHRVSSLPIFTSSTDLLHSWLRSRQARQYSRSKKFSAKCESVKT